MKIKKLEITGFKSFVDRTIVTFPDPITAIVGPNGCGKSNIVDAIRWCMGEQSAKHLRGRAMEDVIFAGSESRGPAGLAEVSLTFDARHIASESAPGGVPWGATSPEEIMITRRLHRDGTSEYLLGGVPCRLRDIVDFFLGTGVGTKAYSIIEQGRVGFIVSSKPEDRRTLIDEAAGITKYKAKKKQAERRMDSTRQHLLRVSDIIGELDSRLRTLRLQAQKAERYKKYKAELRDLELWEASHRFLGLWAEDKTISAHREELGGEHEDKARALTVEEGYTEAERLALAGEAAELSAAKDALFEISNKAQLGLQRAQHYEDEARRLMEQSISAGREVEDLRARIAENAETIAELEIQLEVLAEAADSSRSAYVEQEALYEGLRTELATARQRLEEASRTAAAARTRIARAESEAEAAQTRRVDFARRIEAVTVEDEEARSLVETVELEAMSLEERQSIIASTHSDVQERKQLAEVEQGKLKEDISRSEMHLETLREEAHRRRSRLESLREISARYESFQRGVRAIMQRCAEPGQDTVGEAKPWTLGGSVRGLVADIVQPPRELETAVEAVLGDRLGNIVVESHEVGVEAISYLKEKSEGRSSFIPMTLRGGASAEVMYDALGGGSSSPSASTTVWPTGEGISGPLLELVGYDRQYDKVASYLLGDVIVVDTLDRALGLWREQKTKATLVTLEGEVLDAQGVVTGGAREAATSGILSQKREIRELEELVANIDRDFEGAMERHVSLKQQLAAVVERLQGLLAQERELQMERLGVGKDLDRVRREREQFNGRRRTLAASTEDLRKADEQAAIRAEELLAVLEEERVRAESAEIEAETRRAEALALGERLDSMVQALSDLKVSSSQAMEKRANATATLERLRRETQEHELRVERLTSTGGEQAEKASVLAEDAVRLREEASLQMAEAEARARDHAERQSALEERSGTLARKEAETRALRQRVSQLTEMLTSLSLRQQEARLKRTSLEEQIQGRYRDVQLLDIVYDHHLRPPVGDEEADRMDQLRGLIERMGEINLTAIEESETLQKRFDFLTSQKDDLESALSQLEAAIDKINKTSRLRFQEVFDAVNIKFQEVFPHLFGGGKAKLSLTNTEDMLETGVDIIANPPGKKISQNIELLSGGEKALTAVSLLFAIFLVKPSPFCILDEVDAPLDEANVGRFSEGIREMTDRSQFIVITHNKRTMEIADRLCGVTMEEPGVSKLVAVNLRGSQTGKARIATESRPQTAPEAVQTSA
ncbi:MAG: chromosome segregation protein SMC [Deltaproteobacteria bacterium]|nr:chromosome segregation protein SMC [Deltaproteobacteria bacterium]